MLPDCGWNSLAGAINHMGCSGSAYGVHSHAARNADDMGSSIGQKRDEHSTNRAGRAPHHRGFVSHRPNTRKTSRRQTGYRQTRAIFEAKTIREWRQHEGRRDDMRGARSENCSPTDTCAYRQAYVGPGLDYGACALSPDRMREWQANRVRAGTNQGF